MLLVVAGQLQIYEVGLDSGREHTLWVLASGSTPPVLFLPAPTRF
jgi:hypothetical protein